MAITKAKRGGEHAADLVRAYLSGSDLLSDLLQNLDGISPEVSITVIATAEFKKLEHVRSNLGVFVEVFATPGQDWTVEDLTGDKAAYKCPVTIRIHFPRETMGSEENAEIASQRGGQAVSDIFCADPQLGNTVDDIDDIRVTHIPAAQRGNQKVDRWMSIVRCFCEYRKIVAT